MNRLRSPQSGGRRSIRDSRARGGHPVARARRPAGRHGVVLVVVLWVTAILAVVCLAMGGLVRFRQGGLRRQRAGLAEQEALLSGVELARAVVQADSASADTLGEAFCSAEETDFQRAISGYRLTIVAGGADRPWGLSDESARLNANTARAEMLAKLPGMTASSAEAFVDARKQFDPPATGLDAPPAGLTGPLATLGQVAGLLEEVLGDAGLLDSAVGGGDSQSPDVAGFPGVQPAVAEVLRHLTVFTRQRNVDADGRARVDLNTATRDELAAAVAGHFSDDQIDAVIFTRGARPFAGIGELLTRPLELLNAQGQVRTVRVERQQFIPVADRLTTTTQTVLRGLVNVNTAPAEVLRTLPGLTDADVAAIIDHRGRTPVGPAQAGGTDLRSIAWLLEVLSNEAFAEVCPHVTTRTQQFRMVAEVAPADAAADSPGRWGLAVLERDGGLCRVLCWRSWRGGGL